MSPQTPHLPDDFHSRTRLLLGTEAVARLAQARVMIVGLGAVGGYVLEALARAGVGHFRLIDRDCVAPSNINRQLLATHETLEQSKAALGAARLKAIHPEATVEVRELFVRNETMVEIFAPFAVEEAGIDLVVDAIDSLNPKVNLLAACLDREQAVVSSMGAACRLDPTRFRTGNLFRAEGCPLARDVRKRLRKRGYRGPIPAVFSSETPPASARLRAPEADWPIDQGRPRETLGSLSTTTGIAGLLLAHLALETLLGYPLHEGPCSE